MIISCKKSWGTNHIKQQSYFNFPGKILEKLHTILRNIIILYLTQQRYINEGSIIISIDPEPIKSNLDEIFHYFLHKNHKYWGQVFSAEAIDLWTQICNRHLQFCSKLSLNYHYPRSFFWGEASFYSMRDINTPFPQYNYQLNSISLT